MAMAPPASFKLPVQFLNDTIGSLQIGVLVSYVLLGITTTQTYVYFYRFPDDSPWVRAMVAFVWLVEIAQAAVFGFVLYYYTVIDYGDRLDVLQNAIQTVMAGFVLTGTITTLVEFYFIRRIYLLSKRIFVPLFLGVLSILYLAGTLSIAGAGVKSGTWAAAEKQWGWLIFATAIVSVVVDLGIAGALVWFLLQSRNQGLAKTTNMVDQLIAWSIETGVLTSLCSILILVFYHLKPQSFIWLAVLIVKSRLFSNSLLASLNSRTALRTMTSVSIASSGPRFASMATSKTARGTDQMEMPVFRVERKLQSDRNSTGDEDNAGDLV
uniref:DUF6534 domain-containing protein n=1 Tax=Mycena chlorophos TaxID=658473 RepID=A0ABQ0LJI1_MYCCL|nr:predicted protein [Mycena chlorophos]